MTSRPMISLKNVGCSFRVRKGFFRHQNYTAIKDISLDVNHGETLGIVGRNGAGKSTLLKIIGGIYRPDQGSVAYHGNVSVSLQSLQTGFDPELPGTMNSVLSAMFLGFSKQEALAKLDSIIHFAGLEQWINEPIKTYSTGMRARLGFAVALEMSPDVLLIDEVLGVGDEEFRKKSMRAMKEKILSNQTVVFVSHSLAHLRELCTRVAWLEHGTLQMAGDSKSVLDAYLKTT